MSRLIDLTGMRFGRLEVVSRAENCNDGAVRWNCVCDCGNTRIVSGSNLKKGHTTSCGCLRREKAHEKADHRMSRTRLYSIWRDMKTRCYNVNAPNYKNYGGKGIRVCDEWLEPTKFFDWALESGYSDELTLERVSLDGNYEPRNCKWITLSEQQRNKTTSRLVEINGQSRCLEEWCEIFNMPYKTVHHRIDCLGWDAEKALTTPIRKHKPYEYKAGENHS